MPKEILESVASWVSFQVRKTKESEDDQKHLQRLVHVRFPTTLNLGFRV
jgi:hypothetical protein